MWCTTQLEQHHKLRHISRLGIQFIINFILKMKRSRKNRAQFYLY